MKKNYELKGDLLKLYHLLQLRVLFVREWSHVDLIRLNKKTFEIRWGGWMGDPDNGNKFHHVQYPVNMVVGILDENKEKLVRDIPVAQREVLRDIFSRKESKGLFKSLLSVVWMF